MTLYVDPVEEKIAAERELSDPPGWTLEEKKFHFPIFQCQSLSAQNALTIDIRKSNIFSFLNLPTPIAHTDPKFWREVEVQLYPLNPTHAPQRRTRGKEHHCLSNVVRVHSCVLSYTF